MKKEEPGKEIEWQSCLSANFPPSNSKCVLIEMMMMILHNPQNKLEGKKLRNLFVLVVFLDIFHLAASFFSFLDEKKMRNRCKLALQT